MFAFNLGVAIESLSFQLCHNSPEINNTGAGKYVRLYFYGL
jgi:hypothetical protein